MIYKNIYLVPFIGVFFFSSSLADRTAFAAPAVQALEIIKSLTEPNKVLVTNKLSAASIYLKCASADDTITGDGSDENGWWTLEKENAIGWEFGSHAGGRTCFWCYANNNDQAARDSGNWYIHVDVWGFNDCGGPEWQPDITYWEFRDDGAYADDGDDGMQKVADWGPPPS
ncbi:unnamed protein product, partial [Mesorhabditis belari]|uniref:Uncharacterized protein n=1 Tax=Mesorhabditis belari TaxID=2138241 RepID=A0AAF3E825_9BILA